VYDMTAIHKPRDSTHRHPGNGSGRDTVTTLRSLRSLHNISRNHHHPAFKSSHFSSLTKPCTELNKSRSRVASRSVFLFLPRFPKSGKRISLRSQALSDYKPSPRGLSKLTQRHQWALPLIFFHPPTSPLLLHTNNSFPPFSHIHLVSAIKYFSYPL
jgi:hypothetical protein